MHAGIFLIAKAVPEARNKLRCSKVAFVILRRFEDLTGR